MRFGSVCSGIEAASVAWHPLGWTPAWFAEIEPFPSAVLAHHYPDVQNVGDMTLIADYIALGVLEAPDVLCGGTPCQAFSVAGLRRSLDDARGNLSLTFCELANAIDDQRRADGREPCIVFWENVPGVLSTKDNAFGCFLAGLAGEDDALQPPGGKWTDAGVVLGPTRAVAWRTLDAQFFGLAQRRRRVFVVASAREGFDPAAVLLEFDGVRRDSAPSREAREGVAVCPTLRAGGNSTGGDRPPGADVDTADSLQVVPALAACLTRGTGLRYDPETETETILPHEVAHSLRGEGFDASEDGTGRGTPLVPVAHAFDARQSNVIQYGDKTGPLDTDGHTVGVLAFAQNQRDEVRLMDKAGALAAEPGAKQQQTYIAFSAKDHGADATADLSPTLRAMPHHGSHANGGGQMAVAHFIHANKGRPAGRQSAHTEMVSVKPLVETITTDGHAQSAVFTPAMQVRRLTPRECERLQGFPDDYTLIPWRGKPADQCPDGPRYKALGNSWAVPVVRWIGARISNHLDSLA